MKKRIIGALLVLGFAGLALWTAKALRDVNMNWEPPY